MDEKAMGENENISVIIHLQCRYIHVTYTGLRQFSNILKNFFQLVIHISSQIRCDFLHALLDIAHLAPQLVHVIFIGECDTLPFKRVLVRNRQNIYISLRRGSGNVLA